MTKKLNVQQIQSELAGSVFFPARQPAPQDQLAEAPSASDTRMDAKPTASTAPSPQPPTPRPRRSTRASRPDSNDGGQQASELASMLSGVSAGQVEAIRKIVRLSGKEVSYVRLTPGEKDELADIIYAYKRRGTKTTENEISRIAVNYILADYKENGENSVLARVLEALRA